MEFSCLENEDFGLAKSFTTAPLGLIAPSFNFNQKENEDVENECVNNLERDVVSDGLCFKLAPGEDVFLTNYLTFIIVSSFL